MDGKRLIRSIRLENALSYGPSGNDLSLEPLNVLIGPNASGKSNLIEVLSLLAAAPKDLQVPIREGGGVGDWLWKGPSRSPSARVDAVIDNPKGPTAIRYRLSFAEEASRFQLVDEAIESEHPSPGTTQPFIFYAYRHGNPILSARTSDETDAGRTNRRLKREDVSPEQSILSQRRDPDVYPEITYLAAQFEQMRFYREWNLGRYTSPRLPQKADLPHDCLLEDAGNLGLVLNALQNRPDVKRVILEQLGKFYERVTDIVTRVHGGTVQIFLHEEGLKYPVPATRLSDGTLRFLCLLTVLCHPEPPPVICIEEPELGLHPDVIPAVARLLLDASARTQLFVTTHSDILVDSLSERPEAVVVCERGDNGSELRRLDANQLSEWLERYRLGELWQMGEIGGNP